MQASLTCSSRTTGGPQATGKRVLGGELVGLNLICPSRNGSLLLGGRPNPFWNNPAECSCPLPHPWGRVGSDGCRERRPRKGPRGKRRRLESEARANQTYQERPQPHPEIAQSSPGPLRGQRTRLLPGRAKWSKGLHRHRRRPSWLVAKQTGRPLSTGQNLTSHRPTAPASQNSKEKPKWFQPPCQVTRAPPPPPTSRPYPKKSQRRS